MKFNLLLLAAVGVLVTCFSCIKNSSENRPPQTFSWSIDGGATQVSDSTSQLTFFGTNIIYGKSGNTRISITSNSTNTGVYSMMNANASFGITIGATQYTAISGSLYIATNADRLLSGNFGSTLIVPNVDTIIVAGNFSNIRY